jgi:hypothetical protein
MAKRGLSKINDKGIRKTEDWGGSDIVYATKAVELYEAERPQRFMATLVRRLKHPKPH